MLAILPSPPGLAQGQAAFKLRQYACSDELVWAIYLPFVIWLSLSWNEAISAACGWLNTESIHISEEALTILHKARVSPARTCRLFCFSRKPKHLFQRGGKFLSSQVSLWSDLRCLIGSRRLPALLPRVTTGPQGSLGPIKSEKDATLGKNLCLC